MFLKINRACLLWACLCLSSHAKILKDEVFVTKDNFFTLKKVCQSLTKRESPLIEAKSISKIDCMGKVVKAIDFCEKEFSEDTSLARAIVSDDKLNCQMAQRINMSYLCQGSSDKFCKDKNIGCQYLKENFAHNLRIAHSALTTDEKGKALSCYFTSKSVQSAYELKL